MNYGRSCSVMLCSCLKEWGSSPSTDRKGLQDTLLKGKTRSRSGDKLGHLLCKKQEENKYKDCLYLCEETLEGYIEKIRIVISTYPGGWGTEVGEGEGEGKTFHYILSYLDFWNVNVSVGQIEVIKYQKRKKAERSHSGAIWQFHKSCSCN